MASTWEARQRQLMLYNGHAHVIPLVFPLNKVLQNGRKHYEQCVVPLKNHNKMLRRPSRLHQFVAFWKETKGPGVEFGHSETVRIGAVPFVPVCCVSLCFVNCAFRAFRSVFLLVAIHSKEGTYCCLDCFVVHS